MNGPTLNAAVLISRLEVFPPLLKSAAALVNPDDARWKPAPEHWSILEICCHLLDEDREDFRIRLESTLNHPKSPWPPLLLDGVSEKRGYLSRDLESTVSEFAAARAINIAWLRSLGAADWSIAHDHPRFGPIRAGDLLAAWAAHDALHLRQIAKRLHGLAGRDAPGFTTRYAGDW